MARDRRGFSGAQRNLRAIVRKQRVLRIAPARIRISQCPYLFFKFVRAPEIVRIKEGDQLSASCPCTQIAQLPDMAAVLRPHDMDVWKCKAVQAINRIVSRSVIGNEQLPIPVGLRNHRGDRLLDKALAVPRRNNDGYEGSFIHIVRHKSARTFACFGRRSTAVAKRCLVGPGSCVTRAGPDTSHIMARRHDEDRISFVILF